MRLPPPYCSTLFVCTRWIYNPCSGFSFLPLGTFSCFDGFFRGHIFRQRRPEYSYVTVPPPQLQTRFMLQIFLLEPVDETFDVTLFPILLKIVRRRSEPFRTGRIMPLVF